MQSRHPLHRRRRDLSRASLQAALAIRMQSPSLGWAWLVHFRSIRAEALRIDKHQCKREGLSTVHYSLAVRADRVVGKIMRLRTTKELPCQAWTVTLSSLLIGVSRSTELAINTSVLACSRSSVHVFPLWYPLCRWQDSRKCPSLFGCSSTHQISSL